VIAIINLFNNNTTERTSDEETKDSPRGTGRGCGADQRRNGPFSGQEAATAKEQLQLQGQRSPARNPTKRGDLAGDTKPLSGTGLWTRGVQAGATRSVFQMSQTITI
jgi:hypothetical protein